MRSTAVASTTAPRRSLARSVALLAVLALTLGLAACGDDDDTETIPASGQRETTTTTEASTTTTAAAAEGPLDGWTIDRLTSAGVATQAPDGATLTLEEGTITLATGCNSGSGGAEVGDGTVTVEAIGLTKKACEPAIMAWEADLLAFLEGELSYEVTDTGLTLTRDDATLTLSPAG